MAPMVTTNIGEIFDDHWNQDIQEIFRYDPPWYGGLWVQWGNFNSINGWPAISPDLNPMENLWGILSQIDSLRDLRKSIEAEWTKKIESMPRRVNAIMFSNGNHINY